ncbi:asparagine synthase (glutamine-hydrolyzing) [Bizionia argentinensis JUB59]|uniref:asparagine synthase (glutamine-hydrolyzing) n=1 Tax=Bizionia argentinensis JUB59 TaxID=1046627 RepID=G2E9B4_9FLAO|nr:asparagine synthase (glutamine-hydrolyzing) [Bizionia argentinensis]EGV44835.1 asparagine synthase (glutamine-hydrolyzing) [Bizionia argentinensis JUB59]
MCGIYGSTIIYTKSQLQDKLERTKFRGPDKQGFKFLGDAYRPIIFGHNRLAIIDVDERSNQPFTYNNNIHIVFNGEIYNFKILKKQLEAKNYEFHTTSDTEVICATYLEYGEDCLKYLDGMFAFVIYDETKQKLFGARDRLGKKPFYYYINDKHFEFASQLSSIQLHHNNLTISNKAISYYLAWDAIPDPYSIFNEIKKLQAGHCFSFDLINYKFKDRVYWDIDTTIRNPYQGSYQAAVKDLDGLIRNAVSTRLFADVPVGVFLSGGVDSSVVAALATKTTNSKVKTFSVKFNEKGFDESIYAQKVANHLQTDHHIIDCNYNEGLDLIKNFSHYYDEPFADSSAIPSMLLAKHASEKVTVALSGDGGDESFIGYERYKWMKQVSILYKLPNCLRHAIAKTAGLMPYYKLKMIGKGLQQNDINSLYLASVTGVNMSWLKSDFDYTDVTEKKYLFHTNKNLYERLTDFDIKTYLNWDINTKVDRATMAYSLEARAPLMDHKIVEFAQSLPTHFKFKAKNQKRILKDVLYQYVPKEIFDRPKAGFTMPFKEWFKNELQDYVLSELDITSLRQIPNIDADEVHKMIEQHMDGSWNHYPLIWKLLVLKQWLNTTGKGYIIK